MLRRTGTIASARYALTDRYGGVSRPPYDALDLGDHVGDDPAAVSENRRLLALGLGLDPAALVFMQQVHGTEVAVVESAPEPGAAPPVADALVTTEPGLGLVVLVADCVPVLLAARRSDVVAVAHAGRRGSRPASCAPRCRRCATSAPAPTGWSPWSVRPCAARCYEVPAAMADQITAVVPSARSTTRAGTPGSTCAPASSPSCSRRACRRSRRTPGAPSSRATSTPTAATA